MKYTLPLKRIAITTGLVLGTFAVSAFAGTWTAPTATPPNGNADAPINVGYTGQIKQGNLWLKGLIDASTPAQYGLVVENAPIKASGGLIIETRTAAQGNPTNPETGRMWLMIP